MPLGDRKKKTKKLTKEELLQEITALEGSKEDLELIEGLESGSDDEGEVIDVPAGGKTDKKLKGDLAALMKEIGLDSAKFESELVVADEEEGDEEEPVAKSGWKAPTKADEEDEEEAEAEEDDFQEAPRMFPAVGEHNHEKLLFQPRSDWYDFELPKLSGNNKPPQHTIDFLHERGKTLLEKENELYSTKHLTKSSDKKFLSTIMSSGTLTDKISALTLVCQESPLHTTKSLEALLGLAKKKSRSQAVLALNAIKDLLAAGNVLPDRKLRAFKNQVGLGSGNLTDMHLIIWAYEDWLKDFYFETLKVVEALSVDQLAYTRNNAVGFIAEMLRDKPEQEANLLRLLVNKLGDMDKKVCSRVSYQLLQIQAQHPAMKNIIIDSIATEVLFRPGQSLHAQYYAIITLNQTILSRKEPEVANKLIDLYFSLFTRLLNKGKLDKDEPEVKKVEEVENADGKKVPKKLSRKAKARKREEEKRKALEEETSSKLVSGILTGVNRAFPFAQLENDVFDKHMNTLFQITHSSNFNTSIQALLLIFQVASSKQFVSDRFYRTLYESLLDPRLITSSKQAMYLNLMFKALKSDNDINRVKAFVKRLVQVCALNQPPFITGVFYLLSELTTSMPSLKLMMNTPEHDEDDEEEVFRDVPDEDDEGGVKLPAPSAPKKADPLAYAPRDPDPAKANANNSCFWELLPFQTHFHPTIALFADCLLASRPLPSKPDMGAHTLSHFLDRFVYKGPKAKTVTRGQSIMQPLAGAVDKTGIVIATKRHLGGTVNDESFWKKKEEDVKEDEVFFHRYFNQRAEQGALRAKKKKERKAEEDEDESADEDEIWKALVKSRPDVEADDSDVDFDDDESIEYGSAEDSDGEAAEAGEAGEDDENVWSDEEEVEGAEEDDDFDHLAEKKGDDSKMDIDEDSDVPDFGEDEDDAWSSEDEVPEDLDALFAKEEAELNKSKIPADEEDEEKVDKKAKKRKLKHLPTFATAEEYAHLMSD
ncbi:CBF-domain-containing protein [Ascobolus immersus RN42]|uniref:CBF-domain-containing protein n=1 Tax=Ascobolus immersus RN42 TaxID=1160509 RepID=A0A3N4II99_ASCIM|nr:CBF-domain-containing protein [Ascobolus immersus RN42]